MRYVVIKAFNDGMTGVKLPGDYIEIDEKRAAKYRRMGLIGGRYEAPIRTAVVNEPEKQEAVIKTKKQTAKKLK